MPGDTVRTSVGDLDVGWLYATLDAMTGEDAVKGEDAMTGGEGA